MQVPAIVDCTTQTTYIPDAIVFKMDSISNPEWHHCYGGRGGDGVVILLEVEDGYVISGWGGSNDGDLTGSGWHGAQDVWLIKIDSLGNLLWQQCIGGHADERVYGVVQESDYKYTVAGEMNFSPSADVNCSNFVYGSQQNYWVFGISDTTVNIVENSPESIIVKIYPNPANSLLNIDFPNDYNIQNTIIEIMDINGRTMLKSEPVSISTQLDIKKLNNGLYLVKIQNDKTLITKKIIIHRLLKKSHPLQPYTLPSRSKITPAKLNQAIHFRWVDLVFY